MVKNSVEDNFFLPDRANTGYWKTIITHVMILTNLICERNSFWVWKIPIFWFIHRFCAAWKWLHFRVTTTITVKYSVVFPQIKFCWLLVFTYQKTGEIKVFDFEKGFLSQDFFRIIYRSDCFRKFYPRPFLSFAIRVSVQFSYFVYCTRHVVLLFLWFLSIHAYILGILNALSLNPLFCF